jgi:DNA helicase-2/ATP-dependent DNA helicase PcrA
MREEGVNPLWVQVANEVAEAQLVTEIAIDLIQHGFQPRDILILYRTNHYRAEVESELIENEIPYSILKNTSLFLKEGPFLPLCLQAWRPGDVWEQPLLTHYLGRRSSSEICSLASELKLSPFETAIEQSISNLEIEKGMNLLLQDLSEIQVLRENKPQEVAEIAWAIVEKRGFIVDTREAKGLFRVMTRLQNLGEIVEQIEKLQFLSMVSKQKRLHLSTIHRAKGLEHRAVILLGCVEGVFPLEIRDEVNSPEERRLAYVALTRAKDFFVAISPETLYGEQTVPSRFVREMGLKRCEWVKCAQ